MSRTSVYAPPTTLLLDYYYYYYTHLGVCAGLAEGLMRARHAAIVARAQLELRLVVALLQLGPRVPAGGGVERLLQLLLGGEVRVRLRAGARVGVVRVRECWVVPR